MQDDVRSLSHSKWRCKYHIVFAPKYRRQVIYGKIKADVGKITKHVFVVSPADEAPAAKHGVLPTCFVVIHFALV